MVDILAGIEEDERAMERIATALTRIAIVMEARLANEFPPKHAPRESTFSRIPSSEDRLKAAQGSTGEATIEEWTELGPRERELVEKAKVAAGETSKK